MKTNYLIRVYAIACILSLITFPTLAGGGGGPLDCNTTEGPFTMPNNTTAQDPVSAGCVGGGPFYYVNSDVDGDGCEDVDYSVENNTFFTFTAPAGSGCLTQSCCWAPGIN